MSILRCVCVSLLILLFSPIGPARPGPQDPLRVGIIGLDTSHVVEFTKVLNDTSSPDHVPGARVVAAYKGGSPDVEASASRSERFTAQLRDQWKVESVTAIPDL